MYTLTKYEVEMLVKVVQDYPDAKDFNLQQSSESGIGRATYLCFTNNDIKMKADITDYESW